MLRASSRTVMAAVVAALVLGLGAVFLSNDRTTVVSRAVTKSSVMDRAPTTSRAAAPVLVPGNGWIAFSTQPGFSQISSTDWGVGGDIYLVREGVDPKLIVSRGEAMTTNVCPAFSSDGSKLAYGERSGSDRAVVVLVVVADGSITEMTRLNVPGEGVAPCPRWSSDGMRVAYVRSDVTTFTDTEYRSVVVRGLDGSTPEIADGDPTIADLYANFDRGPLLSPDGALIVGEPCCDVIISRPDGSDRRVVARLRSFYSIPSWSPDGRYILTMEDVSGGAFTMATHTIEEPFESVVLASYVPVNGARSWPGRGDVSWQPVYSDP